MLSDKIAKIKVYQKRLAVLEKEVAANVHKELAALPGKYGFGTMKEFIRTLAKVGKGKRKAAAKAGTRRKRAKITPETKAKVKAAVAAEKTSKQIAEELGISVPSVQNIKKELGLVKKRK